MTLANCEKLLKENLQFRRDTSTRYNIKWNLIIQQPKVDYLWKWLKSYKLKILILLKLLELSLLSDIYWGLSEVHQDLAERINAIY